MAKKKCSVIELLALKKFTDKAKLVSTNADLSRTINHVTIMEAPDFYQWVDGGEFVLTTWYSLSKNPELVETSFRNLAEKISAIGIKTQRFIPSIPEKVLKIASEYKLPVFEIYRETKFRDLVYIISSQIQNYQLNMLLDLEEFNKDLMRASLEDNDIDAMLSVLSIKIKSHCICVNHEFQVVGKSRGVEPQINLETLKQKFQAYLVSPKDELYSAEIDKKFVTPCCIKGKVVGFLLTGNEILHNEEKKLACQQAAVLLSARLLSFVEINQQACDKFLKKLGGDEILNDEYILKSLDKFGIHTEKFTVTFFHLALDTKTSFSFLHSNFSTKILGVIKDYLVIIANKKNFAYSYEKVRHYLKANSIEYLTVLTPETDNFQSLRLNFKLGLDTIEFLRKLNLTGTRKMQDWSAYTMLLHCQDSPGFKYIRENVLKPIIIYDEQCGCSLLGTLKTVLMMDNLNKAASSLHIHINTLRYRLEKINDITGKNFFLPRGKYELVVASLISEICPFKLR